MSDIMCMIDIETMSHRSNAVVLSIGAVKFSIDDGIIDEFSINVKPQGQKELGLHVSPETLEWWKKQSPEAIAALKEGAVDLRTALETFVNWYGTKSLETWAKSCAFDLVILENAIRAIYGDSSRPPWKFWDMRCFRTVDAFYSYGEKLEFEGVAHRAIDDARNQALHLIDFYGKFGLID